MRARFFRTSDDFRAWLEAHHDSANELVVGFYKKGSGRAGITYPEAVDEALCFGWIDGVRRSIDAERYSNRFTPRKPTSNWSAVNVRRFGELKRRGRVRPAGQAAFDRRSKDRSGTYSYEQRHQVRLDPALERRFRAKVSAWSWFREQPASYRSTILFWVMSAKRPETRERRLDQLIEDSANGRRVGASAPGTSR
ncbi:MAG TPA: YdeI/OmpD-associated family protein [Actinomycetota bacterium]|jgi:uncharacterized protein YdeI (YjbR/CyaY-like superfamily)